MKTHHIINYYLYISLILKFDKINHLKNRTENQLKFFNKWTTSDWEYKIQLEPFLQKFEQRNSLDNYITFKRYRHMYLLHSELREQSDVILKITIGNR